MSSKKCVKCGLMNFANVDECKRCESVLSTESLFAQQNSPTTHQTTLPASSSSSALKVLVTFLVLCVVAVVGVTASGVYMTQRISDERREQAKKVMAPLEEIHSTVGVGVNVLNYRTRLTESKIKFDAAMREFKTLAPDDEALRNELASAMSDYMAALSLWEMFIKYGVGDERELSADALDFYISKYKIPASPSSNYTTIRTIRKDDAINAIWNSAAAHIENARQTF